MSETSVNFVGGLSVEIGKIDRELNKLWKQSGAAATRASLINFAIYCEGAERLSENTALIAEFTRDHACRAILIAIEPDSPAQNVQAWISAHCHISRAGAKQICCEQISFLLEGNSRALIPNLVFSHLDSDLPLYLWWRGDFSEQIDVQLWTWVDRLIFDSQKWDDPKAQFTRLRGSLDQIKSHLTLCDLNWTRLLHLRWALAQLFDHPANLAELAHVTRLEIAHAPQNRTTALLLVGWLTNQLGWSLTAAQGADFGFTGRDGRSIHVQLQERHGAAISQCALVSEQATFSVSHDGSTRFFHSEVQFKDGRTYQHLIPAGDEELIKLLDEELMRGGKHLVYLRALTAAQALL